MRRREPLVPVGWLRARSRRSPLSLSCRCALPRCHAFSPHRAASAAAARRERCLCNALPLRSATHSRPRSTAKKALHTTRQCINWRRWCALRRRRWLFGPDCAAGKEARAPYHGWAALRTASFAMRWLLFRVMFGFGKKKFLWASLDDGAQPNFYHCNASTLSQPARHGNAAVPCVSNMRLCGCSGVQGDRGSCAHGCTTLGGVVHQDGRHLGAFA